MSYGACTRLARDGGGGGDVERGCVRDGGGIKLAFAEHAVEGVAGEPNDVASGVHVERDGLGAEGEGQAVVAAGVQRKGDLKAVGLFLVLAV